MYYKIAPEKYCARFCESIGTEPLTNYCGAKDCGVMVYMEVGNIPGKDSIFIKGVSRAEAGLTLKPGETVQARVVAKSNETVILRIGDSRITASTTIPLERGAFVSLVVSEVNPERIVLRQPARARGSMAGVRYGKDDVVRHLLEAVGMTSSDTTGAEAKNALRVIVNALKGERIDTGAGVKELLRQLEDLVARGGEMPESESGSAAGLLARLNEVVVSSSDKNAILKNLMALIDALQHESDVVQALAQGDAEPLPDNLKAALLATRDTLMAHGKVSLSGETSELLGSIEKLLGSINATEIMNLPLTSKADGFFYLPIPIRCGEQMGTAEVRIYDRDGSRGDGDRMRTVTVGFALQMPALGETRAFLELNDDTVSFSMALENKDAVLAANEASADFADSLAGLGYRIGRISISEMVKSGLKGDDDRIGGAGGSTIATSLIEEKLGVDLKGVDTYG